MTSGGELSGRDPRSYLFSPGTYRNFILQADAKLNAIGDSGIVLHATLQTGVPKGYEVQLCNTGGAPPKPAASTILGELRRAPLRMVNGRGIRSPSLATGF